jgi:hypothetical protein
MSWFNFLKRKHNASRPIEGPFRPEDFPCPDPTPGGKHHNGDYSGWLDPVLANDEIAFAVVVPKGSSDSGRIFPRETDTLGNRRREQ